MNPLDPDADAGPAPPEPAAGSGAPAHRTLPPPEWNRHDGPRSAASLALERRELEKPVSRRLGPRAEQAHLRGRLREANARGDADAERDAAATLARALAARGAELDTATKLARRALLLGDQASLRDELSAWFTALGEPSLAAATLRPLLALQSGAEAARTLVRIAMLLCRAGDVGGAVDALSEASRQDPADATAPELLGGIGAWASEIVAPARAAAAYLDGAARREAAGDRAAAFEDLLRALESDPGDDEASARLAAALAARGRSGAADVVARAHARASGDRARDIHLRRMRAAADRGDVAAGVGAGLDAGFDVAGDGAGAALFEELLARAGLHELLAGRLELICDTLHGTELARRRVELGRVYAGPLASPERAVEAWMDALLADPASEDAKASLREHAAALRDQTPLVEAFVRVGLSDAGTPEARAACLRELVVLAEQRLGDPALALWALRRISALGQSDAELDAAAARLGPRMRLQDETLAAARAALDAASGGARVDALRRVAGILRGRPDAADAYLATLVELVPLVPEERTWQVSVERLLVRSNRREELEALLAGNLERARSRVDEERARLALAAIRRRRGDLAGALTELSPLLAGSGAHAAAWSRALVLAGRLGDRVVWASALLRIAATLAPTLRAVLSSVGADALLDAGDVDAAKAAAEQAGYVDPSLARPVATLAAIALQQRDSGAPRAIERAMGVIVPRAELCRALADAYDQAGESVLAVAWTQRWLALRPGDREAGRALLERVTRSGDAARIADALAWLLSQPRPVHERVDELANALAKLARLDASRGSALARRALDVLGPRTALLREVLLDVADSVGEPGLGIAVMERWLASGAPGGDRAELLMDVAARRRAAGDADGAARALARAIAEGADAKLVLVAVDGALPARSSDGELSLIEARAQALAALPDADIVGTARAWRVLGAALWDLASDTAGAVDAWDRAAALDPARGVAQLARDLVAFAGFEDALLHLEALAGRRREPERAAAVLAEAATLALHSGDTARALDIAMRAMELDPTRADVLAAIERSAGPGDIDKLEQVYHRIARAALGCYGERAVHYRAARQLERRGELRRALDHAVRAFEAVPAEGVTYVLAARLAERSGDPAELVRALERVASQSKTADSRAAWLRRAALMSGSSEEGRRQRVDVLLRALSVVPDGETVRALGSAMAELIEKGYDDREIVEMRFEHALGSLLPRLEGPEGGRIAVEAARAALESFGSAPRAVEALTRAAKYAGDIDEYASLSGHVAELAAADEARGLVALVVERSGDRFANVGRPLLELASAIASAQGDAIAAARLLVAAALSDAEDTALVRRAGRAAEESGDAELISRMLEAIPPAERVLKWLDLATRAETDGDLATAIDALERARDSEHITPEDRHGAVRRLAELYGRAGRRDALEAMLTAELERPEVFASDRVRLVRDLAALVAARGDPQRALDLLSGLAREHADDELVLGDIVALARQAGERRREADALSRLADLERDPAARARLLGDLAPLLEALGDAVPAFERWTQLLAIEPDDPAALAALERDAERQGDYERLAALLARRASLATMVDDVRRLRMRRAMVLEQRLGRPDEARAELHALISATGDNLGVLRVLADLEERVGALLSAAPLWLRASAVARDRDEAADLSRRACEAYLAGGDVDSARRVLEGMEAWAHSTALLELAVEIERRGNSPLALAAALEELALASQEPPAARAALLVEAARAAEAGGDDALATTRAERAVHIAPLSAAAQVAAHRLEYIQSGFASAERARVVVTELRGAEGELEPAQAELRVFLVAEALDAAVGGDASLRELRRAETELGVRPLIALGLAERLARGDAMDEALPLFELALAGDLQRMRSRGDVALHAAAAARRSGERERALSYLEVAAVEADSRAEALAVSAEIREERHSVESGLTPASAQEPMPPPRHLSSRPPAMSSRYSLSGEAGDEAVTEPLPPSAPVPREAVAPGPSSRPLARASSRPPARASSRPPEAEEPASDRKPTLDPRRASMTFDALTAIEMSLLDALGRGSIEAGKELIQQLENRTDRSHDLLGVCRRMALLAPGDRWVLEKLHEAALLDRHHVHARAIEHVLAAFDPSLEPVEPPPLAEQPEHPERVLGLLFRDTMTPALEALSIVWEGAEHIFRRDPGTYGVTGLERVPFGAPTPLGRVYSGAARALGLSRAPLFQRRSSPGSITLSVALLSPPALILSGDVRQETPELRFHVGAMLAATLPQHVLLFGSPESQTRAVLKGLAFAFGPPQESGRGGLGAAANLAEVLWESVPTRLQRRLRELCDDPGALDYEAALAAGRQAIRRAGLFVAGDLGVALRETCADDGVPFKTLGEPGGSAALCSSSPAIADLVRVATSSQYAEARWQPARDRTRSKSGPHTAF